MTSTPRRLAASALIALCALTSTPLHAQPTPKPQQFLYVLRVKPTFHDAAQWTARENDAVSRHFRRLSQATEAGKVIFAGRTTEALGATFGLVVFEAESEAEARRFMETDPGRRGRGDVGHAASVRAGLAAQAVTSRLWPRLN